MAHVIKDKVAETSTTTGTGALTLAGAITGYKAFSDVMTSPDDTCHYAITGVDANGIPTGEWETGLGTYSGANTLTRTTVIASSNSDAAVTFSAGTKRVTMSLIASVLEDLTKYILSFFFTTTPTDAEVLMIHVAGAAFTIPADFTAGLQSSVGTNPTSSFALDVKNNGTTIGTITVATDGGVTAVTESNEAKAIAAGDVLTVVAPGTADATAASMAFTIIGAR